MTRSALRLHQHCSWMQQPGFSGLRADICDAKGAHHGWCAPVLQSVSGGP